MYQVQAGAYVSLFTPGETKYSDYIIHQHQHKQRQKPTVLLRLPPVHMISNTSYDIYELSKSFTWYGITEVAVAIHNE